MLKSNLQGLFYLIKDDDDLKKKQQQFILKSIQRQVQHKLREILILYNSIQTIEGKVKKQNFIKDYQMIIKKNFYFIYKKQIN